MNSRKILSSLVGGGSLVMALTLLVSSVSAQDKIDFVKQIKPILEQHCVSCHGGDDYEEFQIDIRDEALNYVELEASEDSPLYTVLIANEDDIMPPAAEENPLTPDQIELIKRWIDEGAAWPDDLVLGDASAEPQPAEGNAATSDEEPVDPANSESNEADPLDPDQQAEADEATGRVPVKKADEQTDPMTQRIFNSIGSLHPAAVHLPLGVLLAAGLFALLSLRGSFVMSDCAYYCLWLGTIGAIAACATGWWFSPMEGRGDVAVWQDLLDTQQKVFWHRTGALVITALAFVLAVFAAGARNRDPEDGMVWKIGLILLACGIGWVGHSGGELHYPPNHYKDLNNLYNSFFESDDANEDDKNPANAKDANSDGGTIDGGTEEENASG